MPQNDEILPKIFTDFSQDKDFIAVPKERVKKLYTTNFTIDHINTLFRERINENTNISTF